MSDPKQFQAAMDNTKCVMGHYRFWLLDRFPRPHDCFTMLRDPVERILSMYSYLRDENRLPWVKDATFAEFLSKHPPATNFQTAFIGSNRHEPDLESAKANLHNFAAVGLTERFDESLKRLQTAFGLSDISYKKFNVTANRLRREDISTADLDELEKRNALNIELYRYAQDVFF